MPAKKRRTYEGRVYTGLDDTGRSTYQWVGRFVTKRERDEAVALARVRFREASARAGLPAGQRVTVSE